MMTLEEKRRNAKIAQLIKSFNEEMLREPGAQERCRKYILENFPHIWNDDGSLKNE